MKRSTCVLLALAALAVLAASGGASAGNGTTIQGAKPTWWQKYEVVSAPGFTRARGTSSGSINVGANVDVSNEEGPQSETSIATNPTNTSLVVAGSNEIDRLPMRGYFSSDGGSSYGGVDLPLPPPTKSNGFDFGSDPGVAWDRFGNVFYSYIVVFFSSGGSIDGGVSFGATHVIAPTVVPFDIAIPAQNTRGALIYPACGADTTTGLFAGTLYCSW